jgi:hypothetical protein
MLLLPMSRLTEEEVAGDNRVSYGSQHHRREEEVYDARNSRVNSNHQGEEEEELRTLVEQ